MHTAVAVLGVTSLSSREAAAEHLAAYVRGHWSIENKIHRFGDTLRHSKSSGLDCVCGRGACWVRRRPLSC